MEEKILIGNLVVDQIKLSVLEDEDKQNLFEWINNKELVEFNSPFQIISWDNHCKWFDAIRKSESVKIFGIRTIEKNKLIGSCQLLNLNKISGSAELQIRLGFFSEMGKGYGSEAVKLLLKYGFEELKLQRIYLHVFSDNIRAFKSYLKNGFKEEGVLRRAAFINGTYKDVKIMSILKEEFIK
jgi:RimJ/RimL family protein N-acetyltransferase